MFQSMRISQYLSRLQFFWSNGVEEYWSIVKPIRKRIMKYDVGDYGFEVNV